MVIVIVGVMVKFPVPVPAAALKNITGVGAELPAGTPPASGYVILLVGFTQGGELHTTAAAGTVRLDALLASLCPAPLSNRVEVIVRFQPLAEPPRVSFTISPNE
jgi:hypothetical protein